ncbi:hypothetical protein J6590_105426 [Homalodisca vitripennis]|nr:hypothetical protein J6590_105426 [Homalodisca vitripennis]
MDSDARLLDRLDHYRLVYCEQFDSHIQSRPPKTAGGWICAVATYGTGEAEEGRESVALRHKLATLCAHCCLVQASGRADAAALTRHPASASASRIVLSD